VAIRDIFEQAKEHPYIVAVSLFACLVVGMFFGVIYMQASNARLDARGERITLLDERLKQQEETTKRQKQINKYVQDQIASLRGGFNKLPPAVALVKDALNDAKKTNSVKPSMHARLFASVDSVERQLVILKTAIDNSEAMQKAIEPFLTGALSEELSNFAKAAESYEEASRLGLAEADARLARLYLTGRGVEKNPNRAIQLYELAALRGVREAKIELADLFLEGRGNTRNPVKAAAYLAVEPSFDVATARARDIERELSSTQKVELSDFIQALEERQATLTAATR
jgi:hypothetical protein